MCVFNYTCCYPVCEQIVSVRVMCSIFVCQMMPNLPSRCMGSVWCCMYNSTLDGLSINTLYRKCKSPHLDSGICCMLIIEPREKRRKNSTAPQSPSTSTLTSQGTSKSASDSFDESSVQHTNAAQPQSNLPTEGVKDVSFHYYNNEVFHSFGPTELAVQNRGCKNISLRTCAKSCSDKAIELKISLKFYQSVEIINKSYQFNLAFLLCMFY